MVLKKFHILSVYEKVSLLCAFQKASPYQKLTSTMEKFESLNIAKD